MKLDLRAPLYYERVVLTAQTADIMENFKENEEIVLCFDINPSESRKIDPNTEQFLGSLLFAGISRGQAVSSGENITDAVCLPKGDYLFVQQRSAEKLCSYAEWLEMAVEQQKDGLWERNKLGNTLYFRFLFEDGAYTVQVFRTVINAS